MCLVHLCINLALGVLLPGALGRVPLGWGRVSRGSTVSTLLEETVPHGVGGRGGGVAWYRGFSIPTGAGGWILASGSAENPCYLCYLSTEAALSIGESVILIGKLKYKVERDLGV